MIEKDPERLEVIARYEALEAKGIFDLDVEEDPEGSIILPGMVDYKQKKLSTRIKAKWTFHLARKFLNRIIKKGILVIKDVIGVENLDDLQSGAVLTCNHFNALDSFAMQVAYERSTVSKKRKLFRVIREGNYTSFPGFYGKLMRACNTLPLSSNMATMKEFLDGVDYQLKKGNLVLVYPEQSMWWNYRKPKPLKKGAFNFAAKAGVPVIPIFICMEDSDHIGPDGFPVQEMTIFVDKPIFPDLKKNIVANTQAMMDENYRRWKTIYEEFYKIPLVYTCDQNKKPQKPN